MNGGLAHSVEPVFLGPIFRHAFEMKLRITCANLLAEANGQITAEIALHKGRLVALVSYVPGVDAEQIEIAGLPFPALDTCQQELRSCARRVSDAIQNK